MTSPAAERCEECGFDGRDWSDAAALAEIAGLPERWGSAVAGLDPTAAQARPVPTMWSVAEYVDHVREVLFGMRFLLDSAVASPGIDLGPAPEPRFDPVARAVDLEAALDGVEAEALALHRRLSELEARQWDATAVVDGNPIDARWVARHAVHDATHHLVDVQRRRRR